MGWVKLSDDFADHQKIMDADEAGVLWVHLKAMCYCAANRTDGLIHRRIVGMDSERLLASIGLWDEREGQFWVHNWLKFNISKDDDDVRREKAAKRKSVWVEKQKLEREQLRNAAKNPVPSDVRNGVLSEPDPDPLEGREGGRPRGASSPTVDKSIYHAMERINRKKRNA